MTQKQEQPQEKENETVADFWEKNQKAYYAKEGVKLIGGMILFYLAIVADFADEDAYCYLLPIMDHNESITGYDHCDVDIHDCLHDDEVELHDYSFLMRDTLRCFMWIHFFFFIKILVKVLSKKCCK